MKRTIWGALFSLSVIFVFSFVTSAFASPQLTKVFDKERSDKEDAVYFRNNDVLKGEILNKNFTITTLYGMLNVPLDKCAGISFEGSRSNTEALVTVNFNRYTGIISDPMVLFKIGSSGTEISIRKEKIRFILLRSKPNEAELGKSENKTDLFIMSNGDMLTGNPTQDSFTIATDYAKIPVSFAETKAIEMQGGENVTAVIKKKNGDVMRGTLVTEEFSIGLDIGVQLNNIYKDKLAKVFVDDGNKQASEKFGVLQPIKGESDGAQFEEKLSRMKKIDGVTEVVLSESEFKMWKDNQIHMCNKWKDYYAKKNLPWPKMTETPYLFFVPRKKKMAHPWIRAFTDVSVEVKAFFEGFLERKFGVTNSYWVEMRSKEVKEAISRGLINCAITDIIEHIEDLKKQFPQAVVIHFVRP